MTTNTNLQLIQYKIIHRTHITQYKKYKMGLAPTDICSQGVSDNYFHAVWACTPVYNFWTIVTQKLSDVLSCRIPLSPPLCLLGDLQIIHLQTKYKDSLLVSLAIAKKTILQNWKSKNTLSLNHWENLLLEFITLLKITTFQNGDIPSFRENWKPFLNYFNLDPN